MCIGGLADVAINTSMVTTSTGSASITDAGFEPDFAMFLRNRPTNLDQEYSNLNSRVTVGFADGTNEVGTTFHGDDGAAITVTGQRHSVSKVLDSYRGDGTVYSASFTSFDSGGLTLNFDNAGLGTGATLMLKFEAGGEPPATVAPNWMSWL